MFIPYIIDNSFSHFPCLCQPLPKKDKKWSKLANNKVATAAAAVSAGSVFFAHMKT
jgi:hypothetical protein